MKHSSRSMVLLVLVLSVPIAWRVLTRPLNGVGMAQLPKQAGVTQMLEGAIESVTRLPVFRELGRRRAEWGLDGNLRPPRRLASIHYCMYNAP